MIKGQSDQWALVFAGPAPLAELYAEILRDNGVPAFVPDRHMKLLDPTDVGGNFFEVKLLVPIAELARAKELLERRTDDELEALDDDS